MAHVLCWEPHGLVRKFWGYISAAEFESAIEEALSDPQFQNVHYSILDFEGVTKSDLDMMVLERIAMVHFGCGLLHNSRVKVALIGAKDLMTILLSSPIHPPIDGSYDVSQCTSESEAREWIHQSSGGSTRSHCIPVRTKTRAVIRRTPSVLRPRQFRRIANGDRRTLVNGP